MLGFLRNKSEKLFQSLATILIKNGVSPNSVTLSALILAIISGILYYFKHPIIAALLLALSGFLDMLDGMIARTAKMETKLGNFLDSLIDRYSDFIPIIAIGIAGLSGWIYVALAIFGSMIPSYTRAKLELNLGQERTKGNTVVGERGDRLLLIILASFIYPVFKNSFEVVFLLIFLLGNLAVILRTIYNLSELKTTQNI